MSVFLWEVPTELLHRQPSKSQKWAEADELVILQLGLFEPQKPADVHRRGRLVERTRYRGSPRSAARAASEASRCAGHWRRPLDRRAGAAPASGVRQDVGSCRRWTWPPAEPSTRARRARWRKTDAADPRRSPTAYAPPRPKAARGPPHPIPQGDRTTRRRRCAPFRRKTRRVRSFVGTSRPNAGLSTTEAV